MNKIECPSNTYLCKEDLEKIIGNVKSEQKSLDTNKCSDIFRTYVDDKNTKRTIDRCDKEANSDGVPQRQCNNCDYMFENLATGNTTCKELFDGLKNMSSQQLKNQIKYNLTQVVRMRAKSKPAEILSTLEWWKEYVWGVNKIQNYIYIISFTVALLLTLYFTYHALSGEKNILFVLGLAIVFGVLIFYYTFKNKEYTPSDTDPRFVENNKSKYDKNVSENWRSDLTARRLTSLMIFAVIFGLVLIVKLTRLKNNQTVVNTVGMLMLAFVIAINSYYTFLIPQFIILGIILQKLIISEPTGNANVNIGLKILVLLTVTVLSFVFFGLSFEETSIEESKCNPVKPPNNNVGLLMYYSLLPGVLTILFIALTMNKEIFKEFMDQNRGWGLFAEPLYDLIVK